MVDSFWALLELRHPLKSKWKIKGHFLGDFEIILLGLDHPLGSNYLKIRYLNISEQIIDWVGSPFKV